MCVTQNIVILYYTYLLQTFGILFFLQNTFLLLSFFKGRVDMLIKIMIKMSQGHNFLRKSVNRKEASHF